MRATPLIPLDALDTGECGTVCTLPDNPELRRRLTALGLIPGTKITVVNISPAGDPKAYFFRGSLIALRHKDAQKILIKNRWAVEQ